jgi:hypothetical protein
MPTDDLAPRSRRAILTAAAGAAGALTAAALIPASVAAADPNDVVMGQDNATIATTSVTNSTADSTAFAGDAAGTGFGYGLQGTAVGGGSNAAPGSAGVFAWSTTAPDWSPSVFEPSDLALTGVYGYAPAGDHTTNWGSGVWGDSQDTGLLGTGGTGVEGYGYWGVFGRANPNSGSVGVYAYAPTTSSSALYVNGKAHFTRSGHTAAAKGKTSLKVTLAGTTSGSKVLAVLGTNASGRFIRAVVPASGSFTVYFNTALAATAYVNWFVLD